MPTTTAFPCARCGGAGRIPFYGNVLNGICFKCHGHGIQHRKPVPPMLQWSVFFLDRATGQLAHAYNQTGRSEADAIRKARALLTNRASAGFAERFDSEQAAAFHCSKVWINPETKRVELRTDAATTMLTPTARREPIPALITEPQEI